MQAKPLFTSWLKDIASIPWRDAAVMLRERFREDRLGLTADPGVLEVNLPVCPKPGRP